MELLFPVPVWIVTLALCLLHAYRSARADHVAAVVKAFALSVLWTAAAVAAFWGFMFLVDFVADVQFEKALFIVIAGWAILYIAVALASFGYSSFLVYAATAACCGWFGWSYRASPWGLSWFAAILGSVTVLAAFAAACSAFVWARWEVFGWRPSEEARKRIREESKRRQPDASDEDIERYLADGEAETPQTLKETAQFVGTVALWTAIATFFVGSAAVYPQAYEHVFASYVSRLTAHKSSQADSPRTIDGPDEWEKRRLMLVEKYKGLSQTERCVARGVHIDQCGIPQEEAWAMYDRLDARGLTYRAGE